MKMIEYLKVKEGNTIQSQLGGSCGSDLASKLSEDHSLTIRRILSRRRGVLGDLGSHVRSFP